MRENPLHNSCVLLLLSIYYSLGQSEGTQRCRRCDAAAQQRSSDALLVGPAARRAGPCGAGWGGAGRGRACAML